MNNAITIGTQLRNATAFTTPHGVYFPAGATFVVELVGTVNARCRSAVCGTVVWFDIAAGTFCSDVEQTRALADRAAAHAVATRRPSWPTHWTVARAGAWR